MSEYDAQFYGTYAEGSLRSARAIVPILVEMFRPRSVADVGCGTGAWLKVFQEHGVGEVLGIDGSPSSRDALLIDGRDLLEHDLTSDLPPNLKRYDMATCLEVGEHLPREASLTLVRNLVRLSDVIVFSAAIPGQGGVHHVNEQWPAYWASLFRDLGYEVCDPIRWKVWGSEEVEPWYAQNILVYMRRGVGHDSSFTNAPQGPEPRALDVVHPRTFSLKLEEHQRAMAEVRAKAEEDMSVARSEARREIEAVKAASLNHRLIQLIDSGVGLLKRMVGR